MSGAAILEIYGANGGLQVSGEQVGFGLSGYGAVTLTDDGQQHFLPTVTATINVQGVNPVLAFRPQAERYVTVSYVAPISGGYAFTLICQSGSPVGLQWWAFDAAARAMLDPTMDDVVAALWDANGVKTFDMAMASAMRVVAAPTFTLAPVVSPPPVGGTLTDQSQVTAVPAGRVWAIAQATLAMGGEQFDTGQYSLQDVSPETGPVVGDDTPPAGAKWRYQQARGYRTMAGYVAPDQIWAGFRIHEETFGQWVPIEQGPGYAIGAGNIDYLILDVTNLPSAPLPEPGALTVAVSGPTQEVVVQSSVPASSVTPACTASASGGVGPYSYQWFYVSGSQDVVPDGSSALASFKTRSVDQPTGQTRSAVWRCRATDAQGHIGWSQGVNFRHIVNAVDLVPDPISSLAVVNGVSNDPDVFFGVDFRRITGISAPITVRVERYSYTGNADVADLYAVRSADGVTWTNLGPVNAKPTGLAYIDFNVAPGEYVGWKVRVATLSGRKTAAMDVVIWNLSDPSGPVQISTTAGNTFVVDNDDNFNTTDVTPDPIVLSDQVVVSNDPNAYSAGTYFTISGISQPITLRFTRDSLTQSGLVTTRRTVIGKSTNGGASYAESNLGAGAGAFVDLTASNGDQFFLKGYVETNSGRGWARWRNIVTSQTTGIVLGSAFVDITVDDDNNWNVSDVTPDPIGPADQVQNFSGSESFTAGSYFTITGINAPITLRFSATYTGTTGQVNSAQMVAGRTTSGYTEKFATVGFGSVDIVANNGDELFVKGYLAATGAASADWTWSVVNITANQTLASATVRQVTSG